MTQITLINPPIVLSMGSLSDQNSIPPLGLAYLSAAARAARHGVQVIDAPGDAIEAFHPIEEAGASGLRVVSSQGISNVKRSMTSLGSLPPARYWGLPRAV
jgi:hypothetical protein